MEITRSFFKGDLFLPAMKPSITDEDTVNSLQEFIDGYSEKCLIECFGYTLFAEVKLNSEGQVAKDDAAQKWKDLIDGEIVTMEDGSKKRWRGINYKSISTASANDMSFIANYVYFFYERSEYVTKSTTGDVTLTAAGSMPANAGYKTSIVWNMFVDLVVGRSGLTKDLTRNRGIILESDFGYYVDWFSDNNDFSLYDFILYKNRLVKDTYAFFAPKYFRKINEMGI
jgi:hypothetical protein